MSNKILLAGALSLLFALGAQHGCAAEVAAAEPEGNGGRPPGVIELRRQANSAHAAKDYEGYRAAVTRLHEMRPYNDEYMYQVVLANALLQDRSAAYGMMLQMQQQGLAADFDRSPETESIRDTEAYVYINDLMKLAGQPAGHAEPLFELPPEVVLATSIAWDASRNAFLVGTAWDGVVFAVSRSGETREILRADDGNGLWGIYGLLPDPGRNRLWVSSSADANFTGYQGVDGGRSALFEFDLETLELVKRYPVPVDGRPHRLGGMALTPDGDIYAVDTILPIVYRLAAGGDRPQPFVASGDMVSLRGLALTADGTMLYVADYEMGILVLDLAGRRATKLRVPDTLNLGGIEGLFHSDGHLVMIQNGIEPQRVMRMKLSDDGTEVTGVAPLAVAQPFFSHPSFGTIHDGQLYFFANSHWVRSGDKPGRIRLARTDVVEAAELEMPDMDEIWKSYQQSVRQGQPPAAQE